MDGNLRVGGAQRGRASGRLRELAPKYGGDAASRGVMAGLASRWHGARRTRAGVGSTVPQGEES